MAAAYLLLAGRSGNGKSSTGNSILGKKTFVPRGVSASFTDEILKGTAQFDGRTVTVVDGLSFGDAGFDDIANVKAAIQLAETALGMLPSGFTALCIVLKYGVRFTQQEKDAVMAVKSIFGDDVIRKYGVIVMSYGDSFDLDMEDERMTFEDWCKMQTGDVKELFKECNHRYVLFNNKSKDSQHLAQQNRILMSKISEIQAKQLPTLTLASSEKSAVEISYLLEVNFNSCSNRLQSSWTRPSNAYNKSQTVATRMMSLSLSWTNSQLTLTSTKIT